MPCDIEERLIQCIDLTEWLSEIFIAPLSLERLTEISDEEGSNLEQHLVSLERRYTTLFEGVFRYKAVLPYEGVWSASNVEAITQMDTVLRQLGLSVSEYCYERPDHLAIELAALAMALRDKNKAIALDLVHRLERWVPAFDAALQQQDPSGFYAAASHSLLILINKINDILTTDPRAVAQTTAMKNPGETNERQTI